MEQIAGATESATVVLRTGGAYSVLSSQLCSQQSLPQRQLQQLQPGNRKLDFVRGCHNWYCNCHVALHVTAAMQRQTVNNSRHTLLQQWYAVFSDLL
jgi:hypothetical protein